MSVVLEPMQICECCDKQKPKRNVHRNRVTRKLTCSACSEKKYRIKRPEVYKLAVENWRLRNPEKHKKSYGAWYKKNPRKRYEIRRQYYHSVFFDPINTRNARQQWTLKDENFITDPDRPDDRTLSAQIGRSLSAIQIRRVRLNKKKASTQ